MTSYLLRRSAAALVLAFVVCTATFFLLSTSGTDPAAALLPIGSSQAQIAAERVQLGLDRPLLVRYAEWLTGAVTGDLGESWKTNRAVVADLATRLPVTLALAVGAIIVSSIVGMALGMIAALRRGFVDKALQLLVVLGHGLPGFWVALVLSTVFAIQLGWFPATGFVSFVESPARWFIGLVLPVTALTVSTAASIAQQTRDSVLTVLGSGYLTTIRSRGLPRWRVLLVHVLRNAAPAPVSVLSLHFISLLGGALLVENVFALPGLGGYAVAASSSGDLPAVLGIVVVGTVAVIIVNLSVDAILAFLNPKVRMA